MSAIAFSLETFWGFLDNDFKQNKICLGMSDMRNQHLFTHPFSPSYSKTNLEIIAYDINST